MGFAPPPLDSVFTYAAFPASAGPLRSPAGGFRESRGASSRRFAHLHDSLAALCLRLARWRAPARSLPAASNVLQAWPSVWAIARGAERRDPGRPKLETRRLIASGCEPPKPSITGSRAQRIRIACERLSTETVGSAGPDARRASDAQMDGGEACHGGERSAARRLPLIRGTPRLCFEEAPRTLGCPRS